MWWGDQGIGCGGQALCDAGSGFGSERRLGDTVDNWEGNVKTIYNTFYDI